MKNLLKLSFVLLLVLGFTACNKPSVTADYHVIPMPKQITNPQYATNKEMKGFVLNNKTKICYASGNETMRQTAEFLSEYIGQITDIKPELTDKEGNNCIVLKLGYESDSPEAYRLVVGEKQIIIEGADEAGVFYGVQTLHKSIPVDTEKINAVHFPAVEIIDYPRFGYRGMHLDVCRHFFPLEFIKKYIDLLALHNINRFHWHLSDDQGWRIEIKKYPLLTEIGSKRSETVIGRNSGEYDGIPYGGFFTQEEAREVVEYARRRFITVIPEIDLPGHMLAALTAYPELGCTGGPYEVEKTWGVFEDVLCAGNEKIYTFLEGVFDEIIDIFPSEFIHVGGDECPKTRWEKCPKCQEKIKQLGIKGDKEHPKEFVLQSYVISRVERYLNSKGRQIIGWDEILEGGLAPNATVMSWRGVEGGIEAAKQRHKAIMVPTSYMYFDYYPTRNTENEPLGIGNYVPLEKVYSFEPIPAELDKSEHRYIIGTQANLWTEYVLSPEHAEYMVLPRMAALSEVQWTMPEKKEYETFLPRVYEMMFRYEKLGYNFGTHAIDIEAEVTDHPETGTIELQLKTFDNASIYYTTDGSEPTVKSTRYEAPVIIDKTTEVRAMVDRKLKHSKEYKQTFNFNKATLKNVQLDSPTHRSYTSAGPIVLVNGKRGGDSHTNGEWLGFYNTDFNATVDLGEVQEISSVIMGTLWAAPSYIFGAREYIVSVSEDGTNFKQVYKEEYPVLTAADPKGETVDLTATFDTIKARYVKLFAKSTQPLPAWHSAAGRPAFLFVDEIIIE